MCSSFIVISNLFEHGIGIFAGLFKNPDLWEPLICWVSWPLPVSLFFWVWKNIPIVLCRNKVNAKKNVFFIVFMVDEKNYVMHSLVPCNMMLRTRQKRCMHGSGLLQLCWRSWCGTQWTWIFGKDRDTGQN